MVLDTVNANRLRLLVRGQLPAVQQDVGGHCHSAEEAQQCGWGACDGRLCPLALGPYSRCAHTARKVVHLPAVQDSASLRDEAAYRGGRIVWHSA